MAVLGGVSRSKKLATSRVIFPLHFSVSFPGWRELTKTVVWGPRQGPAPEPIQFTRAWTERPSSIHWKGQWDSTCLPCWCRVMSITKGGRVNQQEHIWKTNGFFRKSSINGDVFPYLWWFKRKFRLFNTLGSMCSISYCFLKTYHQVSRKHSQGTKDPMCLES